ncbi:MAG TPA: acyl-CoA dehydrogenase family protein, partial [Anaeromyxobacter sp.]
TNALGWCVHTPPAWAPAVVTPFQLETWIAPTVRGERTECYAITEEGAGSDVDAIAATARRDGDDYVLHGTKMHVTSFNHADYAFFQAKLVGGDHEGEHVMLFVDVDTPGVRVVRTPAYSHTYRDHHPIVAFEDVRVPAANVLGEVGKGFKVAMKILNAGRTGLGGGSVGGLKRLIELAVHQARERVQFGRPIATFGSIREKLGQMVVDCYAAETVVNLVAGLADRGFEDMAVESAISKVLATEAIGRAADEALQIAGGAGYMRELPYERVVRDCRINRIFEGTNEILRLFIALAAMNDVGEELNGVAESMRGVLADPVKGFGVLSDYAKRRASLATGLPRSKGRWTLLAPQVADEAAVFEDAARELAITTDRLLRKHGKKIIEAQLPTKRLGDVMIDLFTLGALLARVSTRIEDHGEAAAAMEREILKVFAHQAKRRAGANFAAMDDNEDAGVEKLAAHVIEAGRYTWDNL